MSQNIIKIVNAETGEEIEREMNAEELAQRELDQAEFLAKKQAAEAKIAARIALLERLGLSEEEAKILFQ